MNVVNFKVYLKSDKPECRRFFVEDSTVITNLYFMQEKLKHIFPSIRNNSFYIAWLDSDNDLIRISSDDDLILAYTEMVNTLKILYIIPDSVSEENTNTQVDAQDAQAMDLTDITDEPLPGTSASCDVCYKKINGYRFKCMACPDYDLCSLCQFEGHHDEHIMLRFLSNDMPRCIRKVMSLFAKSAKKKSAFENKEFHKYTRQLAFAKARAYAKQNAHQKHQQDLSEGKAKAEEDKCIGLKHILEFASKSTPLAPFIEAIMKHRDEVTEQHTAAAAAGANPDADSMMSLYKLVADNFLTPSTSASTSDTADPQVAPTSSIPTTSEGKPTPKDSKCTSHTQLYPDLSPKTIGKCPAEPGWTFVQEKDGATKSTAASAPASTPSPANQGADVYSEQLAQLLDMGFADAENLLTLLRKYNGNVGKTVKYLFERNN